MAVEIKELIIRAVATEDTKSPASDGEHIQTDEATAQLVQACVREVLKVIERKTSR